MSVSGFGQISHNLTIIPSKIRRATIGSKYNLLCVPLLRGSSKLCRQATTYKNRTFDDNVQADKQKKKYCKLLSYKRDDVTILSVCSLYDRGSLCRGKKRRKRQKVLKICDKNARRHQSHNLSLLCRLKLLTNRFGVPISLSLSVIVACLYSRKLSCPIHDDNLIVQEQKLLSRRLRALVQISSGLSSYVYNFYFFVHTHRATQKNALKRDKFS